MEKSKLLDIINSKNGTLISDVEDKFLTKEKFIIKCNKGHLFHKNYEKLRSGEWCQFCNKKGKISIDYIKKIAISNDGRCLSNNVKSCKDKLEWECKLGHRWKAIYNSVIYQGHWCPICAGNKKCSIEEMQQLAMLKNGKCLSSTYANNKSKILWECEYGHQWRAIPSNIKNGKWCPICTKNKKLSMEDMHQLAAQFNGICLSNHYINSNSKLTWQCSKGHIFEATQNNIRTKFSWCRQCSDSVSEKFCRKLFETIFKKEFPSIFPKWLKNTNGHLLQLDGFCEQLNIAFEHNGEQHYSYNNRFFKSYQEFEDLQKRDLIKIQICEQNNVKLFIIPALFYRTKFNEILPLIEKQANNFKLKINISDISILEVFKECWK